MNDLTGNFIHLIPTPTIAVTTALKIVSANQLFYQLVKSKGFDEGETTSLRNLFEDKNQLREIRSIIWDNDEERSNFELFLTVNGTKICLEFDISQPFFIGDKAVKMITIKDRTDNYQLVNQLKHKDEKYEALVSSMPDMVLMNNSTGDYIFYLNPEQFESDKGFFTMESDIDSIPLPEGIKNLTIEAFDKFKKTGEPQILKSFVENANGDIRILETKIAVDSSDRLVSVSRDITDQKILELQLENSERRLRTALEINNDGIFDWNIENDTVYFSKSWKTTLGYADDEIVNEFTSWERLVHPDDIEHAWNELAQHINGKKDIYAVDFRMKTKDGSYKWIHARGRVIERDAKGKATRMLGTHTDVTSVKRYEQELLQKNKILEEYAHIATHKLRRPVANLKGLIDLLDYEDERVNIESYLKKVKESVNELDLEILGLNRALQLSRVTYEKPELKAEKARVIYLVDDDEINNGINEKIIKRMRMSSLVFKNIHEPLNLLRKGIGNPDLILLDVYMESDNGWALLNEIKAMRFNVEVVVLTSILHADDIDKFRKFDFVKDVWQKPLTMSMMKHYFNI